jgi:hypothetical protein
MASNRKETFLGRIAAPGRAGAGLNFGKLRASALTLQHETTRLNGLQPTYPVRSQVTSE